MHFIYIIKSLKNESLYIGYTENINRRIREHNNNESFTTKKYSPWELVYLEGYKDQKDALDREKKLKQFGRVYSQLKRRIRNTLQ